MTIAYVSKVNQRAIGAELLIVNEGHIVGITAVATATPDQIRLYEVPLQESPSSVAIPGYSEVTGAPGTNEFKVDYTNGRILFNSTNNGNTVFVTYKGRGSIVDAEDVNELQGAVGVALDYDGEITAGHVKPVSISTNPAHDFTFPNDVTITGDLTVNGTTTTINTETVLIEDALLVLQYNLVGTPTANAGFEVERGSQPNVSLIWNETNDSWQMNGTSGSPILEAFDTGVVSIPGSVSLTGPIRIGDGTVGSPAYSFTSDTDTGIYRRTTNAMNLVSNGSNRLDINASFVEVMNVPLLIDTTIQNPVGSAAAPTYTFTGDLDTGVYHSATDTVGIAAGGIQSAAFAGTTLTMTQANSGVIVNGAGGASGFVDFYGPATGQYRIALSTSTINITAAANTSLSVGASSVVVSPVSSPTMTFNSAGGILSGGRLRSPQIGVGIEPVATFHNAGSTLFGMTTDTNPVSIPTATVDNYSGITIITNAPTATTLGTPTNATAGRFFTILHDDASTGSLTVNGQSVGVGKGVPFMWDGSIWIPVGGAGSFNLISGDPGSPQVGDTWFDTITSQFKGWNGTSIVILG